MIKIFDLICVSLSLAESQNLTRKKKSYGIFRMRLKNMRNILCTEGKKDYSHTKIYSTHMILVALDF